MPKGSDELTDAFIGGCKQAGIPGNPDYNGAFYNGVGHLQLSTRNGRRRSTALGYLDGPLRKPNLELLTEAHTTRILFDGKRAIGVEYTLGGETHHALADEEVILSAGPIRSPQLLELSGVGQAGALQKLGVSVVHDLPGVGENFLDHLQSRVTYGTGSTSRHRICHNGPFDYDNAAPTAARSRSSFNRKWTSSGAHHDTPSLAEILRRRHSGDDQRRRLRQRA